MKSTVTSRYIMAHELFNNIILIVNHKNKCQFEKIAKIGACRPSKSRQATNRLLESRQATWHLMWRTRATRSRLVGAKRTCRPSKGRQVLLAPTGRDRVVRVRHIKCQLGCRPSDSRLLPCRLLDS